MSAPFFSVSEMAELQGIAAMGMQTPIDIWKRTTVETENGQADSWAYASSTLCWIYSTPTPTITLISGAMGLLNLYRVFLPVEADINSGDHAVIGGATYIVEDTIAESTWKPLLRCSFRRVE